MKNEKRETKEKLAKEKAKKKQQTNKVKVIKASIRNCEGNC